MVGSLSISVISALPFASALIWHEGENSDRLRNSHVSVSKSRCVTYNIPVTQPRFSLFIVCSCSIAITVCCKHQSLKSLNSSVRPNWPRHLSLSVESLWFGGKTVFAPAGASAVLIVGALVSGSSGLGSSPGQGHCFVVLGKTLYSPTPSLSGKQKIFLQTFKRLCWRGSEHLKFMKP